MDDLILELFGRPHDAVPDRELLLHIIKELHAMALDLTAVQSTLAALSTNVDNLIAADQTAINASAAGAAGQLAADQAAVNALVQPIADISTKITAALTTPKPAPAA